MMEHSPQARAEHDLDRSGSELDESTRRRRHTLFLGIASSILWPIVAIGSLVLIMPTAMASDSGPATWVQFALSIEIAAPLVTVIALIAGWVFYRRAGASQRAAQFERSRQAVRRARRAFLFPAIWLLLTFAAVVMIFVAV